MNKKPMAPSAAHVLAYFRAIDEQETEMVRHIWRTVGGDGNMRAAFRAWHDAQILSHDEALFNMCRKIGRAERLWKERHENDSTMEPIIVHNGQD